LASFVAPNISAIAFARFDDRSSAALFSSSCHDTEYFAAQKNLAREKISGGENAELQVKLTDGVINSCHVERQPRHLLLSRAKREFYA